MRTSVWDDSSSLTKIYQDYGNLLQRKTDWIAVEPGAVKAGPWDLKGGFSYMKHADGDQLLIVIEL